MSGLYKDIVMAIRGSTGVNLRGPVQLVISMAKHKNMTIRLD